MRHLICLLGLALLTAAPATAATVVNGSFEDPIAGNPAGLNNGQFYGTMPGTGSGWDRWTSLNGWTTDAGPGIEVQTERTLGLTPNGGQYYVELDSNSNSAMTQSVWLERGIYLLRFFYSPRAKGGQSDEQMAGSNGIAYSVADLAGMVTGPDGQMGTSVGTWTEITAEFIAETAATYTLRFAAIGESNSYGGLMDDVSIDYVAPVPVPAAGLLLLGGLGGLAALKRRRKAGAA